MRFGSKALSVVGSLVGMVVLAGTSLGQDRPQAGAMAGVVVAGDRVVPGAEVRIFNVYQVLVRRGETNREGRFGFREFRPGPYVAFAAKRELGSGRAAVRVVSGEVARVRIALHRLASN